MLLGKSEVNVALTVFSRTVMAGSKISDNARFTWSEKL